MKTLEKSKFQMAGNIAVNFTPSSSLGFFPQIWISIWNLVVICILWFLVVLAISLLSEKLTVKTHQTVKSDVQGLPEDLAQTHSTQQSFPQMKDLVVRIR